MTSKYENLSDFEINKKVGKILGLEVDKCKQDLYTTMSAQLGVSDSVVFFNNNNHHDYCNDPSDAWPLIVENNISTQHTADCDGDWFAEVVIDSTIVRENEFKYKTEFKPVQSKNPLRAAMICFLKIKDAQNDK